MDELVAYGTLGIFSLVIAAALIVYGLFILVLAAGRALESGDFVFLGLIAAIVAIVVSGYLATGLWLQRTNRI